jgi:hypothetical protein
VSDISEIGIQQTKRCCSEKTINLIRAKSSKSLRFRNLGYSRRTYKADVRLVHLDNLLWSFEGKARAPPFSPIGIESIVPGHDNVSGGRVDCHAPYAAAKVINSSCRLALAFARYDEIR